MNLIRTALTTSDVPYLTLPDLTYLALPTLALVTRPVKQCLSLSAYNGTKTARPSAIFTTATSAASALLYLSLFLHFQQYLVLPKPLLSKTTAATMSVPSTLPLTTAEPQAQAASAVARGALIVLEGLDRSGKTTQVKLLEQRFVELGRKVKVMRFPGEPFFFYSLFSFLYPLPFAT